MTGGRDCVEIKLSAGQDGAVFSPAQGQGDRICIFDLDDRRARGERGKSGWGFVFTGIVGIQSFDMQIEIVHVGRGDTPAQRLAPAGHDRGDAGDRAADHAASGQFKPSQIPDRGRGEAKMRVVGQERAARGRAIGRCGPSVRGAGKGARVGGVERIARQRGGADIGLRARDQRCIFGQSSHASAGHIGQDIADPVLLEGERRARAQHLGRDLAAELQRHQLDDGHRVSGLPGCDAVGKEEKLWRAAPQRVLVDLPQTGVDAIRIGLQGSAGRGVLRLHGLNGEVV